MKITLQELQRGGGKWMDVKNNWAKYGLPGTAESSADFIISLLMSLIRCDADGIMENVADNAGLLVLFSTEEAFMSAGTEVDKSLARQIAAGAGLKVEPCVHIGIDGKCIECTSEPKEECDQCNTPFPMSRLTKCADSDCDIQYCPECKKDGFSDGGFCKTCRLLLCDGDGCEQDIENGTQHICANANCRHRNDYCDECAKRYLTEEGLCAECAIEDTMVCYSCGCECIESRLVRCRKPDCQHKFCHKCSRKRLNAAGLCRACR